MTSERVIKEAPVPVRLWWNSIGGMCMASAPRVYFSAEGNEWIYSTDLSDDSSFTVELSNGQTVIVRAKK